MVPRIAIRDDWQDIARQRRWSDVDPLDIVSAPFASENAALDHLRQRAII